MKILLEECVTKHLKPYLTEHEVLTVRDMNWGGIKNGKLMTRCTQHSFDILLTIDQNLQYQQNLDKYFKNRFSAFFASPIFPLMVGNFLKVGNS